MKTATKPALGDHQTTSMLPRRITLDRDQDTDDIAFMSDAVLAVMLRAPGIESCRCLPEAGKPV